MPAADPPAPYTVISADTHAGASIRAYREYLDAEHRALYDAWREGYKSPQLGHIGSEKHKNWDDAERNADMETEGVAGEVVFPSTLPPFFRTSVLTCGNPSPKDYALRLAGIRAHNRWLVDWCARHPARRAGVGSVYLNDIDEAIADVRWIASHGLRGGILLPHVPPDCTHILPLYAPEYDRFWGVCEETGVVLHHHGGTGSPDYGPYPVSLPIRLLETSFFSTRSWAHLLLSGVFERFPGLRYVVTGSGCGWVPAALENLDRIWERVRVGDVSELEPARGSMPPRPPSEYARRNVWYGASAPSTRELAEREAIGVDRMLWGNDYPRQEGTYPHTRKSLRHAFHDVDPASARAILGENAARLYDFDLEALAPLVARIGPRPEEITLPLAPGGVADDTFAVASR